jgi:hypothetical protein
VIDVLFHNSSFEITPSLDLGAFIEHNFMTVDERRFSEEQRSRISAQRWTIGISIAGLILGTLTSLGVAYFNFKTYSKDRQVTITNLQQLPKPLQVVITSADATALKPTTVSGLTPSSTRTPPALPSALSRHPASPAPLSGSVQAVPVSSNR